MNIPDKPEAIIVFPLDARPVCYQQVEQWANSMGVNVLFPPTAYFGALKKTAELDKIKTWYLDQLSQFTITATITAWDLLLYGGLIPSRLHNNSKVEIQKNLDEWLKHLKKANCPIYGFSSIMRIPNYNNAEEEPDYWADYGQQLYEASFQTHQHNDLKGFDAIPKTVVTDFIQRREINCENNLALLDKVFDGEFAYQIFCQDDTGTYGLNVKEAQIIQNEIDLLNSTFEADTGTIKAHVQTGADELALVLLSKHYHLTHQVKTNVKINYLPNENCKNNLAKFDGLPIQQVIERQVEACGGIINNNNTEVEIIVFCPKQTMGDHCELLDPNPSYTQDELETCYQKLNANPNQQIILIDLASANGANNQLVEYLNKKEFNWLNLLGYAAWNTPGNAVGSAIAFGLSAYQAKHQNKLNHQAHQNWLLTRLADDWAYQANVRKELRVKYNNTVLPDQLENIQQELTQLMHQQLSPLRCLPEAVLPSQFKLPCKRFFEIQVL